MAVSSAPLSSSGGPINGLESYAKGVYEHADGAPIDISNCYNKGTSQAGGGSTSYAKGWDDIFGKKNVTKMATKVEGGYDCGTDSAPSSS